MRNRNSLPGVLMLCLPALMALPALAQSPAQPRAEIEAVYRKVDAAMMAKDVRGMFAYTTPQTQFFGPKGEKFSKAHVEAGMKEMVVGARTIKGQTTILNFAMKGELAVVQTKTHAEMTAPDAQTRKLSKVVIDAISLDSWSKTAAGWRLKTSKEVSSKLTLNGQVLLQ